MNKPFSQTYVIRETLKHIERAIAISTQKTVQRVPEFQEEPDKLKEVMNTLASLSNLNKLVLSIRENNKMILGDE